MSSAHIAPETLYCANRTDIDSLGNNELPDSAHDEMSDSVISHHSVHERLSRVTITMEKHIVA